MESLSHPLIVLHGLKAHLAVIRTQDKPGQRVVVLAADGIELVVMAAGTGHGEAQERLGEDIDFVIDAVAFVLANIYWRMHLLSEESPAGAQDRFIVFGSRTQSGRGEQIPGEMFL